MAAITNILVPVDLRTESSTILDHARLPVDQFGAQLHLITVVPVPIPIEGTEFDFSWYGKYEQELQEAARGGSFLCPHTQRQSMGTADPI